jgi:hypothetical protein
MFALVEISGWFKAAIRALAILARGCRTASRPGAIRFDRPSFG